MKIKQILIYSGTTIALLAGGGYILKSNKEKNDKETAIVADTNSNIAVNVAQVKYESLNTDYLANGSFLPYQELDFPSEVPGKIIKVFVKEGSHVSTGQVLATIRKDAIEVDRSNAQAIYQNALINNQRYESAYKTGGITQQQLDQSRLQLKNAKANLEQANIRVGDTNIKASISGIINKKHIEPGAVVAPGTPLFQIVNVSKLKLKVTVNETEVVHLKLGDVVKIKASAYPDKVFFGTISFIAPLADASLNFPVEILLDNKAEYGLKAGMYATAIFSDSKDESQNSPILVAPKEAFVNGVSNNQVFVVNKDNTVKLTKVVSGRNFDNQIEILQGLKPGETIVTSGQINLIDGSKIIILK